MSSGELENVGGFMRERDRFSVLSVLITIFAGTVGAWILSLAYGLVCYYNPIIYINFLVALGMGYLVGTVSQSLMRRYKIDSLAAATCIGLIVGAFALWFSWVSYVWVILWRLLENSIFIYFDVLVSPLGMLHFISLLADDPLWTIEKAGAFGSWFYYLCWLIEGLVMVGYAVVTTRSFVEENRLCNRCGDWLSDSKDRAFFHDSDSYEVDNAIRAGDFSFLLALPRHFGNSAVPDQWIEAKGFACPNCEDEECFASVYRVTLKPDKDKKSKLVRSETTITKFVQISSEIEKRLFEPTEEELASIMPAEPQPASSDGEEQTAFDGADADGENDGALPKTTALDGDTPSDHNVVTDE